MTYASGIARKEFGSQFVYCRRCGFRLYALFTFVLMAGVADPLLLNRGPFNIGYVKRYKGERINDPLHRADNLQWIRLTIT